MLQTTMRIGSLRVRVKGTTEYRTPNTERNPGLSAAMKCQNEPGLRPVAASRVVEGETSRFTPGRSARESSTDVFYFEL